MTEMLGGMWGAASNAMTELSRERSIADEAVVRRPEALPFCSSRSRRMEEYDLVWTFEADWEEWFPECETMPEADCVVVVTPATLDEDPLEEPGGLKGLVSDSARGVPKGSEAVGNEWVDGAPLETDPWPVAMPMVMPASTSPSASEESRKGIRRGGGWATRLSVGASVSLCEWLIAYNEGGDERDGQRR